MATTWNAGSRTKQNLQTRTRQWRPLCDDRRSKSASSSVFFRVAFLILLAFSVIAKASKGQDEDLLIRGPEAEVLVDEGTDGGSRGNLGDVPADGADPIQFLRGFAESGDKNFGGRTAQTEAKRKWSNNEYLRVWGKRNDDLMKLSRQDPAAGDSDQKEILRNDGRTDRDHVLLLFGLRRSDVHGNPSLAQIEDVARKSGTQIQVFDEREFGPQSLGMATGIPRPDEPRPRRKWERNSLRIWGKRSETNPVNPGSLNDRMMYTNMRRRKWENLPLRVWGK